MSTHILNIAFDFDDEAVRRKLVECAYDQVVERLTDEAKSSIGGVVDVSASPWEPARRGKVDWKRVIEGRVDLLIGELRGEIVEAAAEKLADRLARTKAAREALGRVLGEEA